MCGIKLACHALRLCCELLPSRWLSSSKHTFVPSSGDKAICSHSTALAVKWCMGVSTSGGLGSADGRLMSASMDGACVVTKYVGGPWSCRWAPAVNSWMLGVLMRKSACRQSMSKAMKHRWVQVLPILEAIVPIRECDDSTVSRRRAWLVAVDRKRSLRRR